MATAPYRYNQLGVGMGGMGQLGGHPVTAMGGAGAHPGMGHTHPTMADYFHSCKSKPHHVSAFGIFFCHVRGKVDTFCELLLGVDYLGI